MPEEFRMGDVVRLRKPHPCGGFEWEVVRLGADIGLRCRGCRRRVLLERRVLERRLRAFVARGEPTDPEKERLIFREGELGA
jgi:hypothetical protein